MHNRRQFLLQFTAAAASYVFVKPLKAFAISPADTSKLSWRLRILNLNNFDAVLNKLPANSFSSLLTNAPRASKIDKVDALLLGTGNIIGEENSSKTDHIEKLSWLKEAGCDAIAPNINDLKKGAKYYNELADECHLTSLLAISEGNSKDLLPYHIVSKGDIKVGVIGNNSTTNYDLTIEEIAEKLDKTAAILKTVGHCHLIVSMNPDHHNNSKVDHGNKDREIAALTKKIDVIVSSNNTAKDPVTYIVRNAARHEVIVNYQGKESAVLKGLDISFDYEIKKTSVALRRVA